LGRARLPIAPAAVIPDGLSGCALLSPHLVKLLGACIAAIGLSLGQQQFSDLPVPGRAAGLEDRLAVPIEPEPSQAVKYRANGIRGGAFPVGIFDAQQELAAGMACVKPVEQRRACATDVQIAGGRGGKAQDGGGLRHDSDMMISMDCTLCL